MMKETKERLQAVFAVCWHLLPMADIRLLVKTSATFFGMARQPYQKKGVLGCFLEILSSKELAVCDPFGEGIRIFFYGPERSVLVPTKNTNQTNCPQPITPRICQMFSWSIRSEVPPGLIKFLLQGPAVLEKRSVSMGDPLLFKSAEAPLVGTLLLFGSGCRSVDCTAHKSCVELLKSN